MANNVIEFRRRGRPVSDMAADELADADFYLLLERIHRLSAVAMQEQQRRNARKWRTDDDAA